MLNIAPKGTALFSHVPGAIDKGARLVNKEVNIAKDIIDKIPHQKARDALTSVVNKGSAAVTNATSQAQRYVP